MSPVKEDVDSYNDNDNPGAQIEMVYDFTMDLEDMESGNLADSTA